MVSSSPKEMNPTLYKLIEIVFGAVLVGIAGMVIGGQLGIDSLGQAQYARMWARDYSVFFAALCGIESAMSAIRGKDDITNHLVSGSGAGLALSFLRQGFKLRPAHALSSFAVFAVIQATIYKVKETIKSRNAQDALYTEARAMLSMLGLEEYEKNFKKGRLTDPTLPLLTDRELREVNIPPGPRLLILDHIKRYPKMVNRKYLLLKLLEFGQFWSQLHLAMAGAGTPNRLRLSAL
ncbi:hypothetical protein F2Q70_00031824 [Brassica cretica]|uniref:SAM domain-containing protein n=2 Tax=Brassica cretica TaxID=69181 RepID=A0A8S9FI77_BRACR|nr:hypothetical protein F2Q70_00031824 [Brassica cretica]